MPLLPTFETRNIHFRGNTSSNDFNNMNNEIALDLTNIFQQIAENESLAKNILETLLIDNQYLADKAANLETKINHLIAISGTAETASYINFYNKNNISFGENLDGYGVIPEEQRANIQTSYNSITLPLTNQTSKNFLYDFNKEEVFVPEDLKVRVYSNYNGELKIEETDILNAFNQDHTTQWKRKIFYDASSNVNEVSVTVEIELPKSIINNMDVNAIYINPFPDGMLDVENIEYKTSYNTPYQIAQNFTPQINSTKYFLGFSDTPITHLKITLKQREWIDQDGMKMFVIGLQNIGVFYNDYAKEGRFLTKFNLKNIYNTAQDTRIAKITEVLPLPDSISEYLEFKLYAVEEATETLREINFNEIISESYNEEFWIETKIKATPNTATPVLNGLIVKYEKLI